MFLSTVNSRFFLQVLSTSSHGYSSYECAFDSPAPCRASKPTLSSWRLDQAEVCQLAHSTLFRAISSHGHNPRCLHPCRPPGPHHQLEKSPRRRPKRMEATRKARSLRRSKLAPSVWHAFDSILRALPRHRPWGCCFAQEAR